MKAIGKRACLMLPALGILGVITLGNESANAEDRVAPVPPGRIVRPVLQQVQFKMKVQDDSLFNETVRGVASVPASTFGLEVTLVPEKVTFAANGPLAFTVELKNVSEKPFLLYGAEHLGREPTLVISNQQTAAQWTLKGEFAKAPQKAPVKIEAGKTISCTLVVQSTVQAWPRPVPRLVPQPIPLNKVGQGRGAAPVQIAPSVEEDAKKRKPIIDRRRPPVIWGGFVALPCGQGQCRARLLLDFQKDPSGKEYDTRQWKGRLASGVVEFTVNKTFQHRQLPPQIQPRI